MLSLFRVCVVLCLTGMCPTTADSKSCEYAFGLATDVFF